MATYIAGVTGTNDSGGTSLSASSTLNVQAGDCIAVEIKYEDFTGTNTVTDNDAGGSNTYTLQSSQTTTSPYSAVFTAIAKANNTALTVTAGTTSTSDYRRMIAEQGRPASGKTFAVDQATHASGSGTSLSSGSVTAGAAGIAFAFFGCDSSIVFTPGSGWTSGHNISGDTQSEYQVLSAGGSITGNGTITVGVNWTAHVVNFKEVTAGTALTGQAATSTAGTIAAARALTLTGQSSTSAAGVVAVGVSTGPSGQSAAFAPGAPTPSISIPLAGQSASFTSGTLTYSAGGNLTLALAGQSAAFATGSITSAFGVNATGQSATTAGGALGIGIAFAVSGQPAVFSAGAILPGVSIGIGGQPAAFTAGTVTYSAGGNLSISLTGSSIATAAGALVPAISMAAAGQAAALSTGTVSPNTASALVGQSAASASGTMTQSRSIAQIGNSASFASGTIAASMQCGLGGQSATFSTGTVIFGTAAQPNVRMRFECGKETVKFTTPAERRRFLPQ